MWTYERALAKAKKLKHGIDACTEFENAYMFSSKADEYSFGGDDTPIVIMKDNGATMAQTDYYDTAITDVVRDISDI